MTTRLAGSGARGTARTGARTLFVGAMIATLVGCGGSGSSDDPFDPDGDIDFGDSNDDGIPDRDLDGDGRIDDVNGDGLRDFDLNGDGILDVDLNENGIADVDEGGSGDLSCPGGGEDPDSSNDLWSDNCELQRDLSGERRYTSYYTRGVQRILYCLGFDEGVSDIGTFADAQYGPTTERAVSAYQDARGLTADGIVGAQTWGELREELVRLTETQDDLVNRVEPYAIGNAADIPGCGNQVQFYRSYDANDAYDGWEIANNAGDTQRVEFSIRDPFQ